jgi:putative nucleotidyltransferase with HDIG domain
MTRELPALDWDSLDLRPASCVLPMLLETMQSEGHTRQRVCEVLASDAIVAARVLSIANSPMFRGASPIRTLDGAVGRVGEQEVCRVVMALSAEPVRRERVPGYGHEGGALFRSALTTAAIAEDLAPACGVSWGEAFTTGLLVDVGKLVLGPLVERDATAFDGDGPFDDLERAHLGVDHANVGAALLRHWGLPESIVEAVASHHGPSGDEADPALAALIHFADAIAAGVVDRNARDGLRYVLDERRVAQLDLAPEAVEHAIVHSFAVVARVLSLTSNEGA